VKVRNRSGHVEEGLVNEKYLRKTRWLLVLLCLSLTWCAAPWKPREVSKPEPPKADLPRADLPKLEPITVQISDVKVDRNLFNPTRGEIVAVSYRISKPAKVIIKIFDPEMFLVRDLMSEYKGGPEPDQVTWDGRDSEGRIVPDETYFFTIEATDYQGKHTFYDPTTISGGEIFSPQLTFDKQENRLFYQLPKDARVRIRAGIPSGGPLLKNITHWVPRLSGNHEEVWEGKDESGTIDIIQQEKYVISAEAVSLPENSIIASGNKEYDYFKYKNDITPERPKKVERPLFQSKRNPLEGPSNWPLSIGPEPRFHIDLPGLVRKTEDGLPVVKGKTPIRIYLDQTIKRYVTEQRYEILFFVDYKFVTEREEGYSPFNLFWDTAEVSNGEHVITVNVVTLTGQVSSASMKVMVQN
jgi:hypothetical protein